MQGRTLKGIIAHNTGTIRENQFKKSADLSRKVMQEAGIVGPAT